jgi:hypothetical protein
VARIPWRCRRLVQTDFDTFDGLIYLTCSQPSAAPGGADPHYYNGVLTITGSGKRDFMSAPINPSVCSHGSTSTFPPSTTQELGHRNKSWLHQPVAAGRGLERLTALEVYYDKLAILSTEAIQIWAVDPDPAQNAYVQLLRGHRHDGITLDDAVRLRRRALSRPVRHSQHESER